MRETKRIINGLKMHGSEFMIIRSFKEGRYTAISSNIIIKFTAHLTPNGGYYSNVTSIEKMIIRNDKCFNRVQTAQRFLLKCVPLVRDLGWAVKEFEGLDTIDGFLK